MFQSYLTLKTKLVRLVLKKKWQKTYMFLQTKTGNEQAQLSDTFGLSALSIALANRAPLEIVALILEIKPSQSQVEDSSGMIPLHMACKCGASSAVISFLLEHDKGTTASAVDNKKKTPLHYSAKYLCEPFDLELCSLGSGPLPSLASGSTRKKSRSIFSASRRSAPKNNSAQRSETTDTDMSMTKDEFQDQLQTIQILLSVAPQIIFCGDAAEDTPVDIIQDCKADHFEGSKWERADIACEVMREVCTRLYREEKKHWESCRISSADSVASSKSDKNEGESVIKDEELFQSVDYSLADISVLDQDDN
jgi:hypothetical protein